MLFLFIPIVMAIPPVQTTIQENENRLIIVFPQVNTYKYGSTVNFHFHIFNSSAKILNASNGEIQCTIHIANSTGEHKIPYSLHPHLISVETNITFNESLGIHNYNVWCNSSKGEYGYLGSSFYVTEEGQNYPPGDSGMTPMVIIAGIFAFCFLLLYIGFNVDREKHFFLQLIILIVVIIMTILIPKTILDYTNNYGTSTTFYKGVIWFIRIFWGYVVLYIFSEFGKPFLRKLRVK